MCEMFGVILSSPVFRSQRFSVNQQIVVIHHVRPTGVAIYLLDVDLVARGSNMDTSRSRSRYRRVGGCKRRNDVWTTPSRKSFRFRVDRALFNTGVYEIFRVFTIEDGIVGIKSERDGVTAKGEIADPVKCPAPNFVDVLRTSQRFNPSQHLAGRAIGECCEENSLWRYALFDQIRDTISDRPRLPRTSSCNHQRSFRGAVKPKLLLVQLILNRVSVGKRSRSRLIVVISVQHDVYHGVTMATLCIV